MGIITVDGERNAEGSIDSNSGLRLESVAYGQNGKIYLRETTNATTNITHRNFYYVLEALAITPAPFYIATDVAVINFTDP